MMSPVCTHTPKSAQETYAGGNAEIGATNQKRQRTLASLLDVLSSLRATSQSSLAVLVHSRSLKEDGVVHGEVIEDIVVHAELGL